MSNINEDYIEDYIREVIPESTGYLKEMERYAEENHVPIIHPEVAQFMKVLINIKKPKRILEIGAAIGYSSIVMVNSMGIEGKVVTIERRDDMIELARRNIEKYGYHDRIKIIKGEAQDVLPNIEDTFDMIFLDAAKSKYMDFLPYCIKNLAKEGVIISDNVLYKGMIANDDLVVRRQKTIVRRMREYLDYICNNPMFESSIIPIGDGVALTYKKEDTNE
ncbi:O-methyltransferase [Sporosalibacterium faouarense]|uniref:O-methyltransferase n=1 Tax=Sporosalibacterium faouarense TaxID=516123 RepID=UPI00141D46B5|nr:O-methyltransferase [Sporosalibacterium faouarense]MTI48959.1 O-methyltransferase [Bacillota bacterium]